MRNKYAGYCYKCGKRVERGEGYFERIYNNGYGNKWRLKCISCVIDDRRNKSEKGNRGK